MRIMKKLLLLFLTMLLTLPFGIKVNAQCTSGTLSNLIVTPSTCNNNGKVQVDYSIGGGPTKQPSPFTGMDKVILQLRPKFLQVRGHILSNIFRPVSTR